MRYVVLLIAVLCAACSANNPDSGTGMPELDSTEAGLATGAVIGAGVGALVGSTAGEAGAGVVLGSIAGATSGGLIGKSLDNQGRRIDQHDAKAGINSRAQKTSSRSSLSETIWASSSSTENNRPSGTKGIASKYVEPSSSRTSSFKQNNDVIQLRQEKSSAPSMPKTVASNTAKNSFAYKERNSASDLPPAITPTIELQKPKPELPSYNSGIPSRKPTLLDSAKFDSAKNTSSDAALQPGARAKLKDNQKKIAESVKATQTKVEKADTKIASSAKELQAKTVTASQEKTSTITEIPAQVENTKEKLAATALPDAKTNIEEKTAVAKSVAPTQAKAATVCDAGTKDYERATNASSESDKVFYLRRVILSCPKDTGARLQLGKVYSKLGLKDEAKKEFNTVLDNDPSNESAQDEMSIMMLDSRKN